MSEVRNEEQRDEERGGAPTCSSAKFVPIRSIANRISSIARSSLGPSVLGWMAGMSGGGGEGEEGVGGVGVVAGKARVTMDARPSASWAELAGRSGVGGRARAIARRWVMRDMSGSWADRNGGEFAGKAGPTRIRTIGNGSRDSW